MKLKISLFFLLLFIFGKTYANTEKIYSFDSRIEVLMNGDLDIVETIKVRLEGIQIKRGIFRAIPNTYQSKLGSKFKVDFEVKEITRDGITENFRTEKKNGFYYIYLGNEDVFLTPGDYTYTIHYVTNKQVGFYKDFDEVYWNVNGTEWDFEIDSVSAFIIVPAAASIKKYDAYTGFKGESGKDFKVEKISYRKMKFSTTRKFYTTENLSIGVAWQKGIINEPTIKEKILDFFQDNQILLIALFGSLLSFLLHLWNWKKVGVDPDEGTIIPLFKPMGNLSPSAMRYILKMKIDEKAFTSALVSMATKGVLKIEKKKSIYYLIRIENASDTNLSASEKVIFNSIFSGKSLFKVSNANHTELSRTITKFASEEKKTHQETYFKLNRKYLSLGIIFSILTLAAMFFFNEYSFSLGTFSALVPILFFMFVLFKNTSTTNKNGAGFFIGFVLFFIFISNIGSFGLGTFEIIVFAATLIFLLFLNLLFAYLMKAPTLFGRKEMDRIEGFKMFLKTAEESRLDSINAPEKTPQLFEEYLPYAIALDCENQWADKFKDVIKKAMAAGTYSQPTWYVGNGGHFSPSTFTRDVSAKFNNSLENAAAPPSQRGSSSGGGWSGGSGGGGFSGGGGGGGGGGGW